MKSNAFTKAVSVTVILMFFGIGISACNKAEEKNRTAKVSNSSLEESIDKTIDDTQEVMSDSWITTKVKSELMADNLGEGFDVKVSTENGVVSLSGSLQNQDAVDQVTALASEVEGVTRVNASNLVVKN